MKRVKQQEIIQTMAAVLLIAGMAAVAEILGDREIIFPEVAALVIGGWLTKQLPWRVSRLKMFGLMTGSAAVGVLIVRFFAVPLEFQILAGLCYAALALLFSRTMMIPLLSACILPILMRTESLTYIGSVAVLTACILLVRRIFEKNGSCMPVYYEPEPIAFRPEILGWLLRVPILFLLAILAVRTGCLFLIAPPLAVTFVAVSQPQNQPSQRPWGLWLTVTLCGLAGTLMKGCSILLDRLLTGTDQGTQPAAGCTVPGLNTVCICLAFLLAVLVFRLLHMHFPPAGALALLPFLLPANRLAAYPFCVAAGCAILILAAYPVRRILNGV